MDPYHDSTSFKKSFYASADYEYWKRRFFRLSNYSKRLKDPEKKKKAIIDFYSIYIQIIEILFTNVYAISLPDENFVGALFITNSDLRNFIEENFKKNTKYSSWFLKNLIFLLWSREKVTTEIWSEYSSILKECVNDYLNDYELLNSFKHGYRVSVKSEDTTLSIITQNQEALKITDTDSSITYFSKRGQFVYEKQINFKLLRLEAKVLFLICLLENMRTTYLYTVKLIDKPQIYSFSLRKKEWSESFGSHRWEKRIFELGKKNKKLNDTKNLESILKEEFNNFRVSQSKFPNEANFIDRLVFLYQKLPKQLATYPREKIPVLSMFWNCFGNLIQASRMLFEGHVPEAYTLMSKSAESLSIARKLSLNPDLITVWISRSDMTKSQFKKKWGQPFPEDDDFLHPEVYHIYDMTSDYGRHPNLTASIFNIDLSEIDTGNRVTFKHSYFEDELNLRRIINHLINTYILFAKKFAVIFEGYLSEDWLEEMNQIELDFNNYKETLRSLFSNS